MTKEPAICPAVREIFTEDPRKRFPAVMFCDRVCVALPRHLDAINLAFVQLTEVQQHRISNRIADGKEDLLFGWAFGDGSGWEWDESLQKIRLKMYGFI